jgi:hypothetical protein
MDGKALRVEQVRRPANNYVYPTLREESTGKASVMSYDQRCPTLLFPPEVLFNH